MNKISNVGKITFLSEFKEKVINDFKEKFVSGIFVNYWSSEDLLIHEISFESIGELNFDKIQNFCDYNNCELFIISYDLTNNYSETFESTPILW